MRNRLKEYFSDKTGEQIFSFCLLIGVFALMLFCAIVRLCGGLWFSADLSLVKEPNKFWQEVIKGALLVLELIFVYKILCRTSWFICFVISLIETIIGIIIGRYIDNLIVSNIFYLLCYLIIPVCFVKHWFTLIESIILYTLEILYGFLFLVGRIGTLQSDSAYNFIYNVLGTIDYKLFIIALFLTVKYFKGIKLWKNQKRLIFQTDLPIKNKQKIG